MWSKIIETSRDRKLSDSRVPKYLKLPETGGPYHTSVGGDVYIDVTAKQIANQVIYKLDIYTSTSRLPIPSGPQTRPSAWYLSVSEPICRRTARLGVGQTNSEYCCVHDFERECFGRWLSHSVANITSNWETADRLQRCETFNHSSLSNMTQMGVNNMAVTACSTRPVTTTHVQLVWDVTR
ncbi:hypothetical protein J6590_035767 [Homalodisca vitripennis]|nr:hypothetical protein J6590_035767 [Homalodisca vitripennis]